MAVRQLMVVGAIGAVETGEPLLDPRVLASDRVGHSPKRHRAPEVLLEAQSTMQLKALAGIDFREPPVPQDEPAALVEHGHGLRQRLDRIAQMHVAASIVRNRRLQVFSHQTNRTKDRHKPPE